MDEILSGLGNRVFVMNNVHEDKPVVFQTRWALSYLRGPLTRDQIQTLMSPCKQTSASATPANIPAPSMPASRSTSAQGRPSISGNARPVLPPDVPEFFMPRRSSAQAGESLQYCPALLGVARLHYADKKAGIDHWETLALVRRIDDDLPAEAWS